jgi:hypothetical protein
MIAKTNIERPDWADAGEILLIVVFGLILVIFAGWKAK